MELVRLLEEIRWDFFTDLNLIFSVLGEELVVIAILCLIYWCYNKKLGYQLAFSWLISGVIVNVSKLLIKIPRPFIADKTLNPVEGALGHATGFSFPSGHTQSATSIYGTLSIYFGKRYKLFGFLFIIPIICIAFSRMYLGVHTPYDVLAGFAVGLIVTLALNYLYTNYCLDSSHYGLILLAITIVSFAVMIFAAYEMIYVKVEIENYSDCFKVAASSLGFIFGWYIETTKIKFHENTYIGFQILKYICGIIGVIIIKLGLSFLCKQLPEEYIVLTFILPYFFTTFWITGIYPIFIKKFFTFSFGYRN